MDDYQIEAFKYAKESIRQDTTYLALGIAGESGEVAEKIKKILRGDLNISREDIAKEVGDVLWYVANMAGALGYKLSEVAELNLTKLKDRQDRNVISGNGDNR